MDLEGRGHSDKQPVYSRILFQRPELFAMDTVVCFRCYVFYLTILPMVKVILCWWAGALASILRD